MTFGRVEQCGLVEDVWALESFCDRVRPGGNLNDYTSYLTFDLSESSISAAMNPEVYIHKYTH